MLICVICSLMQQVDVQEADFLYLTGLTQPGVALVESSSSSQGKFTLFLPTPTDHVCSPLHNHTHTCAWGRMPVHVCKYAHAVAAWALRAANQTS